MSKSSKGRTKPGRQQVKSKKKKQPQKVSLNKVRDTEEDSDLGIFEALVLCKQAVPDLNALEQRLIAKGLVAVNLQNSEAARFLNSMSRPESPTIVVQTPGMESFTFPVVKRSHRGSGRSSLA